MDVNIPVMQDTLDRLTAKIDRWGQTSWCRIPGGADQITDADIEAGRYHDFELPAEFIEWWRTPEAQALRNWDNNVVPIADCGTSFCVAGDVCVANGYTFVAAPGTLHASHVVKNERLLDALTRGRRRELGDNESAPFVAQRLLGIDRLESDVLFSQFRSLPEIWGVAYAVTGGEITLPETLPASTNHNLFGNDVDQHPTATATETRRQIFTALLDLARDIGTNRTDTWARLATEELDKLDRAETSV
jgi:hypothetical protein